MKKYFDKGITMQAKTVQHKAPRSNDTVSRQTSDSDRNGASAAPPAYGIDFLDHQKEQSNPTGLPDKLKVGIENLSGLSMNDVRVHYNSSKPAQLQALAYTQGTDIHVGTGQERHVPHEAWHVVQQAQGRVQPTMQMKGGVPINDDKGLEHEADVMGEKAMQMTGVMHDEKPDSVDRGAAPTQSKNEGYRSPALQMRSKLPRSSVTTPVIQRLPKTWGGEWFADTYTEYSSGTGRGISDMHLRFKPGNVVDAELIGLTQSVRGIHNKAPFHPNNDPFYKGRAIKSGDAITVDPVTKETDEGTKIDRAKNYNNPIYPVQSLPSASLDDTNTSAGWGELGYRYTDKGGTLKEKDATLIDAPMIRSVDVSKNSGQIFETTALATKGNQAGTYYGSVRWGWRSDDNGNFAKLPLEVVSQGVPSSTFMKSAEMWNASKSATGADTVDLPTVDVKITTAPITAQYPPGFIGPPLQIPAGTRVQIIRNATPPSTNGQIKVVDGVFTGNTLDVTPADMANLRDERP